MPRGPLDGPSTLRWLAAHSTPGVDGVDAGAYRRLTAGGVLVVEPVRSASGDTAVRVSVSGLGGAPDRLPDSDELARVGRLLDLDRDLDAVRRDLGDDRALRGLFAAHPGLRVVGLWSGWEALIRVVISQQVSVAGARTLAGRVTRRATPPVTDGPPGLDRYFPTPEELARIDPRAAGLTGARSAALVGLARAVVDGELVAEPEDHPDGGPGWLADLSRRRGVGAWTLAELSMRVLHDPDAWPAGDLVLRRACAVHGVDPAVAAVRFRPWRAYAATLLWEATFFAPAAAGTAGAGKLSGPRSAP